MKRLIFTFCLLFSAFSYSQSYDLGLSTNKGQLSGFVLDKEFGNEPLAFATIKVIGKHNSFESMSEINGSFSLDLKPGTYTLIFTFTGYKTIEVENIKVQSNSLTSHNQLLSALTLEPTLVASRSN